jgi:hypothetical protein
LPHKGISALRHAQHVKIDGGSGLSVLADFLKIGDLGPGTTPASSGRELVRERRLVERRNECQNRLPVTIANVHPGPVFRSSDIRDGDHAALPPRPRCRFVMANRRSGRTWAITRNIEDVTVDPELSDELVARLTAEAARQRTSVSELATEALSAHLPEPEHRLGFVGIGASGRRGPIDIHDERTKLAAHKLAEEH